MTHQQQPVPFLHPHHVNLIRERLHTLIGAFYFAGDYRVLQAAKSSMTESILELFPHLSDPERALLEAAVNVRDKDELKRYMALLEPYVIPLPTITAAEIKKLFPKVKKLVLPNLNELDFSKLTYIGWRDIATTSLYLVHHLDGKWVGTECKYVLGPKNRSYVCKWCNQSRPGDEAALVTTQVKNRDLADGYMSVGNHLCLNSAACNQSVTSTDEMDTFLRSLKKR